MNLLSTLFSFLFCSSFCQTKDKQLMGRWYNRVRLCDVWAEAFEPEEAHYHCCVLREAPTRVGERPREAPGIDRGEAQEDKRPLSWETRRGLESGPESLEIHFAILTNTFGHLDKYIWQFGQKHLVILTNTLGNLEEKRLRGILYLGNQEEEQEEDVGQRWE